jgi:hypothetical protein
MLDVGLEIRNGKDDVLRNEFLSVHREGNGEQNEYRHQGSSVESFARARESLRAGIEVLPAESSARMRID